MRTDQRLPSRLRLRPLVRPGRFRIDPTEDVDTIRRVMSHPRLWPWMRDDFTPLYASSWKPALGPGLLYLRGRDLYGDTLAIFPCTMRNGVLWEIHCAILPRAWGSPATTLVRMAFEFLFHQRGARRIEAAIPSDNRLALALAHRAGMSWCGVNTGAFQRNGRLHDLVLMGISKE